MNERWGFELFDITLPALFPCRFLFSYIFRCFESLIKFLNQQVNPETDEKTKFYFHGIGKLEFLLLNYRRGIRSMLKFLEKQAKLKTYENIEVREIEFGKQHLRVENFGGATTIERILKVKNDYSSWTSCLGSTILYTFLDMWINLVKIFHIKSNFAHIWSLFCSVNLLNLLRLSWKTYDNW